MAHEAQKRLLKVLSQEQAAALLNALPPDDRTAFLNELPLDLAMQMLGMLTPDERQVAQSLLAYPAHSVGRMMTLDFVAVRPEWTVRQALDYIREHGYDRETLNIVYVVDEQGHLVDDIRARRLLLSPLDRPIRELLDGNYTMLEPADDREKALALFKKFDRVALPVVDEHRKLIGIVTVDDMLDVAEAEATEDIQKLGGSEALDEPYTTIALSRMVKKRASWLIVLFLGEMLTATAMSYFEDEIARAVVLALFVPLVISSGGNAGSQAATLGLAHGLDAAARPEAARPRPRHVERTVRCHAGRCDRAHHLFQRRVRGAPWNAALALVVAPPPVNLTLAADLILLRPSPCRPRIARGIAWPP
jgi:magnesium transporter